MCHVHSTAAVTRVAGIPGRCLQVGRGFWLISTSLSDALPRSHSCWLSFTHNAHTCSLSFPLTRRCHWQALLSSTPRASIQVVYRAHRWAEREFFIDNLLVRIHFIIVMIRWTGLAPWEFEFPFPQVGRRGCAAAQPRYLSLSRSLFSVPPAFVFPAHISLSHSTSVSHTQVGRRGSAPPQPRSLLAAFTSKLFTLSRSLFSVQLNISHSHRWVEEAARRC